MSTEQPPFVHSGPPGDPPTDANDVLVVAKMIEDYRRLGGALQYLRDWRVYVHELMRLTDGAQNGSTMYIPGRCFPAMRRALEKEHSDLRDLLFTKWGVSVAEEKP